MSTDRSETFAAALDETLRSLRDTFASRRTRSFAWRAEQLKRMRKMVVENENEIATALQKDLGKSPFESAITDTIVVTKEIDHALAHLAEWMRPERVSTPLVHQLGSSQILREPLGVVLVIAPWNYPFQLALTPMVAAIAAGNAVLLKPSEVASHTSTVLATLLPKYLDRDALRVLEGGVAETSAILERRFDHIFFTGSTTVGRIVAKAAAPHLTPVTLELGGKSPTIVLADANLDVAAKRIVWGKFLNAGQTCIAPDYILVEKSVEAPLIAKLKAAILTFYGESPKVSPDFARIVSDKHFARLASMIEEGELVHGGETATAERYIAPTLLKAPKPGSRLMNEEIFGPILPIVAIDGVDDAIRFVLERPKPLALYIFTESGRAADRILEHTSSGGACINDTVSHFAIDDLPFGGVGESGMGAYHGRHGFETFSHRKGVLDRSTRVDPFLRYPPYDGVKQKWVRRLL
jgi:aldehyde dehydrogenase (NAD+)